MRRILVIVVLSAAALPSALFADRVTADRAVDIAAGFTQRGEAGNARGARRTHGGRRPRGAPTGRTRTYAENGAALVHLVALDGGGFVAVSAAETAAPILGFSSAGELPDESAANPFWTLAARTARATAALAATSTTKISSASGLDDVRVEPLVQSKWDQKTAGGKNTYNLYTPHNWYCGCVATAMAQLMRFHRHPTAAVKAQTFTCSTNGVAVALTMQGGTYDWDLMPDVPDSATSDAARAAIGRICSDAGIAVRMDYAPNGSGAYGQAIALVLKDVFGYANAQYANPADSDDFAATVQDAVLTNLDAGYPVILGIATADNAGHAILADGYGYFDGTLFCHLNMGWSGANDYWYALPTITAGGYSFTILDGIAYNIFPDFTGEIASGRVVDPSGAPVAGAQIAGTAVYRKASGGTSGRPGKPGSTKYTYITNSVSAVTDARGIYAVFAPAGETNTVSLAAARDGWTTAAISTNVVAALSPTGVYFDENGALWADSWDTAIGSRWGNDLVLGSYGGADAAVSAFEDARDASGWSFTFTGTPGAWYVVEQTASLANPLWTVITNTVLPQTGARLIEIEADRTAPSRFYRARPVCD